MYSPHLIIHEEAAQADAVFDLLGANVSVLGDEI